MLCVPFGKSLIYISFDADSQFSLYSNESAPSLLQDSHQDSPPVEGQNNSGSVEPYTKPPTTSEPQFFVFYNAILKLIYI